MKTKQETRRDPQGYTTKVTRLGNGQYGCRVLQGTKVICEAKADSRMDVGPTLKDLLRDVDILFAPSSMAHASRRRPGRTLMAKWVRR